MMYCIFIPIEHHHAIIIIATTNHDYVGSIVVLRE